MRSPTRARNIALGCCVAGIVIIPVSFLLPDRAGDMAHAVLFIAGLMLFVFGGVAALIHWSNSRSFERLRIEKDLVARWRVDEQTWRDFLALDDSLHSMKGQRLNELVVRKHHPVGSIHVIVGKEAVEIDGDFHSFHFPGNPAIEYIGRSTDYPYYLELGFYRAEASFPQDTSLRIPFPKSAERDAIRVQRHFEAFEAARASAPPLATGRTRLVFGIALAALALAIAAAGFGYMRTSQGDHSDLVMGLLIGGLIGAVGIAAFLVAALLLRRATLRRMSAPQGQKLAAPGRVQRLRK
jgi:hypothetical protein